MIPFFLLKTWHFGPFAIEPFGAFVVAGALLGVRLIMGRAKQQGLDPQPMSDFALVSGVVGIYFAHWVDILFYEPFKLHQDPLVMLKFWDGLSSFGGVLGAIVAALVFFPLKKLSVQAYSDAWAYGTAPGWAIARLGCFVVHDHPGSKTDFPLAVAFPTGARHDLGLYDALWLFVIAGVLLAVTHKRLLAGRHLALLGALYGPMRFFLDFLRATDLGLEAEPRYLGLTPGQYFSIALTLWGVWAVTRTPAPAAPAQPSVA